MPHLWLLLYAIIAPMMSRRTPLRWMIALLLLSTLFAADFVIFADAAPSIDSVQASIVISEFRTRGETGFYDEFVELFNPTQEAVDISGWVLRVSADCGSSSFNLITISSPTTLSPGQHYLLASESATDLAADQTWSPDSTYTLSDKGGVALFDPAQVQPVDGVGMCADTLYHEGRNLPPMEENINISYERLPGGDLGNCWDTDDNLADFLISPLGSPQRSTDPFTSACIPSIPTLTYTGTSTPLPPNHLVISEFRTRGTNGEDDEFVEIYNPTADSIQLGGWQVLRSSGCGMVSSPLFIFPDDSWLLPGHHFLAASVDASLAIPPDLVFLPELFDTGGLALLNRSGLITDQVGMCATTLYREGVFLAPMMEDLDQGYERKLGGTSGSCYDTGNNIVDFVNKAPGLPQNLESPPVFCIGVLTSTPVFTSTYPGNASHIVISEFRTRGLYGASDEFIELYNPTGSLVNIGGWSLKKSSGCSSTISTLVTITSGMLLLPGQHYLLVSSTSTSLSGADQAFSPGIDDSGGLALLTSLNVLVDQAGMCLTTAYREGAILEPMSGNSQQSYERRFGGSTSCQDTNNNLEDFLWRSSSAPQNRLSPIVMCSGVFTDTPTLTPTKSLTLTRTSSVTPTIFPGNVVINEYLPRPASDWDNAGEANSRDEYIELINMGVTDINIKNWKLDDIADGGSSPFTLPDLVLSPLEIVRFFASETGISLSDGGDTVRLLKPDGRTADLHNYTIVTLSDQSWCRLPDGSGAWAFICRPTPGRPNIRADLVLPPPGEHEPGILPACFLPDTVPLAFWLAECDNFGLDIWDRRIDQEINLSFDSKWGLFLK